MGTTQPPGTEWSLTLTEAFQWSAPLVLQSDLRITRATLTLPPGAGEKHTSLHVSVNDQEDDVLCELVAGLDDDQSNAKKNLDKVFWCGESVKFKPVWKQGYGGLHSVIIDGRFRGGMSVAAATEVVAAQFGQMTGQVAELTVQNVELGERLSRLEISCRESAVTSAAGVTVNAQFAELRKVVEEVKKQNAELAKRFEELADAGVNVGVIDDEERAVEVEEEFLEFGQKEKERLEERELEKDPR